MNDNKLKIRIQIQQQPPQAIEQIYPDLAEPEIVYEQSYDWGKIAIAAVALLFVITLISYLIFGSNKESASSTETSSVNQTIPTQDSSASTEITQSQPGRIESQHQTKTQDVIQSEKNTPITESMSTPATKPKPEMIMNKPMIIPRKKPNAAPKVTSQQTPDQPQIIRAQLSHAIKDREPVDIIDTVKLQSSQSKPIFFYLHVRDLQDQEITIHWYHGDKLDSQLPLKIHADNWRTNASKQLDHERLGAWRVEVVDNSGKILATRRFTVTQY